MYLKSIKVREFEKEIEFAYPKMISKDKIEFMTMKLDEYKSNHSYISDKCGRISLRKTRFIEGNRTFTIKPVAQMVRLSNNNVDYNFSIIVNEVINGKETLIKTVSCSLSHEDKSKIHDTFTQSCQEKKSRVSSIENLEVCFWCSEYESIDKEESFNEISMCFPAEPYDNEKKECWENKTYLEDTYLEKLLEHIISEKYGFTNIFGSLDIKNVIKDSKYRFDSNVILSKMNQLNESICRFSLGSIIVEK